MKEEFNAIKTNLEEIIKTKKDFEKQRMFFNLKVEEVIAEKGIKEFAEETKTDSYSRACIFYEYAEKMIEIIDDIRMEHPKYGETRIREVTKKTYLEENLNSSKMFDIERMLDNYFMYDNCGFLKVKQTEENLNKLTKNITTKVNDEFGNAVNLASSTFQNPEELIGIVKKKTKIIVRKSVKKALKSILLDEDND